MSRASSATVHAGQPAYGAVSAAADVSSDRGRVVAGLILSLSGGTALVLAFPPFGLWPLIFVALVPVVVAQHRVLPPRWAGVAPAVAVSMYVGLLVWGALRADQRPLLVALVPLLWVAGNLDRALQGATRYRHVWWSSPVLWTAGLFLMGLSPITSWVDPAFALYRQPWLIQPVSVVSVSGLNLLILVVNYLIAAAFLHGVRRRGYLPSAAAFAALGVWIVSSIALLGAGRSGAVVRVAVVQPGPVATSPASNRAAAVRSNPAVLDTLMTDTRTAAGQGAQLVVWPEEALRYFDPRIDDTDALRRLARTSGVYLVIGFSPDPQHLNQATVLSPSGQFLDLYNKQHPITFQGDHSIGGPVSVAHTNLGVIAPIICYDLDYQNTARAAAHRGAQALAVPSEDWPAIADQHYTHLVFRAVENHLATAKADTAWDSAIIDPNGRILRSRVSPHATRAVLVARVPLGTGHSFFVTTGNWTGWTTVTLSAAWTAIALTAIRRHQK